MLENKKLWWNTWHSAYGTASCVAHSSHPPTKPLRGHPRESTLWFGATAAPQDGQTADTIWLQACSSLRLTPWAHRNQTLPVCPQRQHGALQPTGLKINVAQPQPKSSGSPQRTYSHSAGFWRTGGCASGHHRTFLPKATPFKIRGCSWLPSYIETKWGDRGIGPKWKNRTKPL